MRGLAHAPSTGRGGILIERGQAASPQSLQTRDCGDSGVDLSPCWSLYNAPSCASLKMSSPTKPTSTTAAASAGTSTTAVGSLPPGRTATTAAGDHTVLLTAVRSAVQEEMQATLSCAP